MIVSNAKTRNEGWFAERNHGLAIMELVTITRHATRGKEVVGVMVGVLRSSSKSTLSHWASVTLTV